MGIRKKFILLMLSIILSGFALLKAQTVNPSAIEFSLLPGGKTNGFYTVQNNTETKKLISIEHELFAGETITNWLKFNSTSFTLNPGQTKFVNYEVFTPKDFKNENIAKIFFKQTPITSDNSSAGMSIITSIGSTFYVSPNGKEIFSPQVNKFSINQNNNNLINLSLNIQNNGNVHLRYFYDLIIFNEKGLQISKTKKNIQFTVVTPGDKKEINVPITLDNKLLPGKYSALIHLVYGNVWDNQEETNLLTSFEVK